jgi:intein/homing endonuclease
MQWERGKWCKEFWREYKLEWVPAGDLTYGDVLVFPRRVVEHPVEKVDIVSYLTGEFVVEGEKVRPRYAHRETRLSTIAMACGCCSTTVQEALLEDGPFKVGSKRSRVVEYVRDNDIDVSFKGYVGRYLSLTPDVGRMFGYFVSEGSVPKDGDDIRFGNRLASLRDDFSSLFSTIFGFSPSCDEDEVVFQSAILSQFFRSSCGKNCYERKIPEFIMNASVEVQKEFIRGYWLGDGNHHSFLSDGDFDFSTSSEVLAHQLRTLLVSLGFCPVTNFSKEKKEGWALWQIQIAGLQVLEFEKILRVETSYEPVVDGLPQWCWIDENYLYMPIRKLERVPYEGDVYNLEVEGDESYVAGSVVVHNCGLPTIATNATGLADLVREDISYPVKSKGWKPEPRCSWITPNYRDRSFADPDYEQYRDAVWSVYTDREEAKRRGAAARKFVVENFSAKSTAARMKRRLEEIVSGKMVPDNFWPKVDK